MATKGEKRLIDEAKEAALLLHRLGHDEIGDDGSRRTLAERIQLALSPMPKDTRADRLYTSHEVGALLQMDPSSIVKWVNDGLLPSYRTPGGHRRMRRADLVAFMKEHQMFIPPELLAGAGSKQ